MTRWQGLRPTGRTLPDGSLEPSDKPIIVSCSHTRPGICADCADDLRRVLADVPEILDDLDVAISGAVEFVERGVQMGTVERLIGGSNPAVAALQRLTGALAHAEDWFDARDPARLADDLAANLGQLMEQPECGSVLRRLSAEVSAAVARAHRVIDAPRSLWFYGPCPDCGRDLWLDRITDDDAPVVCGTAGCPYAAPLSEHRLNQLDAGEDRMLTEDELIGAITQAGEVVSRKQIRRFVATEGVVREQRTVPQLVGGRLVSEVVDVYRLGDVRALAAGEQLDAHKGTLTSREVAQLCGISEATVRKCAERGHLVPVRKYARPLRFEEGRVEAFRASRKASA